MRAVLAAVTIALFSASAAFGQVLSEQERDEVRELVREYILSNPSIIEEAIVLLEEQRRIEEAEATRAAIAEHEDAIYRDSDDFSTGAADARVQIVEFFDYNCSFCRRSAEWVRETLAERGDEVRFTFIESPIFIDTREGSGVAARAALAAARQGRYLDLHFAMMTNDGSITPDRVFEIAEEIGVNMTQLRADMEDPAFAEELDENLILADQIGLMGTPYFVVNGEPVRGARFEELDGLIDQALGIASDESAG